MKQKLMIVVLMLALALCPILSACGNNTDGATADQSSPTTAAVSKASSASSPSSSAPSSKASSAGSGASSKAASSSAPNAEQKQQEQQAGQENQNQQNRQEEQAEQQEEPKENPASQQEEKQEEQQSATVVSGEPIYSEDKMPSFTIAITDKSSKKAYSASCGFMADRKNAAGVNFFLPAGEYHIAVYPYDGGKTLGAPLITKEYKLNLKEDERKNVRVIYISDPKSIEIEEFVSDRIESTEKKK